MAQSVRHRSIFFGTKMTFRQILSTRPLVLGILVLALVVVIGVAIVVNMAANWQAGGTAGPQALNQKIPILCAEQLELRDSFTTRTFFTAEVVPSRTTDLSFLRAGRITKVLVDDGDQVIKDQTIALLDHRHLDARKVQLTAELKQAESVLDELSSGPRAETIRAARAQLSDVNQQLQREQNRLERSEELFKQRAISKQQHEQTLFGVRALEAKVELANSQLDELLAGTRLEKLDAQRATVAAIEASLQSLQYDLEDCEIKAPFSGLISDRVRDDGAIVSPGNVVCQLIENHELEIHVGLPLTFISQLSKGGEVDLYVDKGRQETQTTAYVRSIVKQVDSVTRTVKVVLTLKNPLANPDSNHEPKATIVAGQRATIVAGQSVRLGFDSQNETSGFWVPSNALTGDHRGLWSCFVWKPSQAGGSGERGDSSQQGGTGIARRQSIEVLHEHNDLAFVRGTLAQGDWLISEGVQRLTDRQRVRIKRVESRQASPGKQKDSSGGSKMQTKSNTASANNQQTSSLDRSKNDRR